MTKKVRQRHQKTTPSEENFPRERGRQSRKVSDDHSEGESEAILIGHPNLVAAIIEGRLETVDSEYINPPLTKEDINHEIGQNSLPKHHIENLERSVIV